MTESLKSAIFFVLAVVCIVAAYLSRPAITEVKMDEMVGKVLFPNFTDPLAVKRLEIIRPNAAGDAERFAISEVNGAWAIPSHENYPADAKEQMGRVTEALVGLKVLALAPNIATAPDPAPLYTLYGVVEPSMENDTLPEGAGVKVRLAGENDTVLAELVIGKETKQKDASDDDSPMGRDENAIRYIRVVGQSPVYEAEIDISRFSTSFDQWIEKNLLDVSSYDVKEVFIDEYSLKIDSVLSQGGIRTRIAPNFIGDILFGYDGSKTGAEKWGLTKWTKTQGETSTDYVEQKLSDKQELNTDILDSMLSALNDLKIVDVSKKPNLLATALREGKPLEKIEDDVSLQRAGFYLVPMPDLKGDRTKTIKQMLSNEGNLQIRMKDGIRYTLRFGDLTGTESEIAADDEKKEDSKDEPAKEVKMGENRYVFITADFDETTVAKPDLKPVPELPADETDEEKKKTASEEKERIEKSNQRENDRYNEAIEAGKKRAKKLTDRFADWYYVIPEDVYKKIRLTNTNVFREKKEEKPNPPHGEPGHVHMEGDEHEMPALKPYFPTLPGMKDDE
ncbi:MAG: DUF4340 domain-containing protein [Planctomycetaceae bacterium]|nr:DUF4340 domain-containing protein [Planctomycetaceae bacterium]